MADKLSTTNWKQKALRLSSSLARHREQAKESTRVLANSLLTVSGGAAAGALAAKFPYLPGTTFPSPAVAGGALLLTGVLGFLDEQSDIVASLGSGMLAAVAARETEKLVRAA